MRKSTFGQDLLDWFERAKRDLPWRNHASPYEIWISEIMLQQTRVAVVVPFYLRFLERFPTVQALAAASESDVLACWAGLGYYSRARNMHKAARQIADVGAFPATYQRIRDLPGVGDYTSAAIASIAFGLPHAAVDGNVLRVLSRLRAESARAVLVPLAGTLLDRSRPGDYNQAMMELGATVCLPSQPRCGDCPVTAHCEARARGLQAQFPLKKLRPSQSIVSETLLLIERKGEVLFWQRPAESKRMAGFWDLPRSGQLASVRPRSTLAVFEHTIVNTRYRFEVAAASLRKPREGFRWLGPDQMRQLPLSTVARKALKLCSR